MRGKSALKLHATAALFLLPALFFIAVYIIYPIFDVVHLSTLEWNGISPEKTYVGLENWKKLFSDKYFWGAQYTDRGALHRHPDAFCHYFGIYAGQAGEKNRHP